MPICSSCESEYMPGTRWCGICQSNTTYPGLGKLASPVKRLAAFALDVSIPVIFLFSSVFAAGAGAVIAEDSGGDAGTAGSIGASTLLFLLVAYWVVALNLFSKGTTPGKKLLGMRVVKNSGEKAGFLTMLLRETIGRMISGIAFTLGYLWILFDKENQAWHDKFASTYVVSEDSRKPAPAME